MVEAHHLAAIAIALVAPGLDAGELRFARGESFPVGVREHLLLTRFSPRRVATGEMMSVDDVKDILGLDVVGVVPESVDVLSASNAGVPVILNDESDVSRAYEDAVARLLGETVPLRFVDEPKKGFFARMFGG